ncbi:MFS transporter [Halostella litorea]|uniref:MFS transporter n=1 Tax=Halostella litorea TaxID=2528831 RepID=UPI001092CE96|nr:MFS transporter [Halostella litorea]
MNGRGWDLLGVTTAAFFATMVARLSLSPLVPDIIDAFAVSKSTVGLALSGMWAAYALFQFPGGILADRIGERRVVLLAMGATGTACAVLAAAPTFPLFALFAVVLGASAGLYFTAGVAFLTGQFEDTGRALGVHEIGASSAGLVAPVASAYAATRVGWWGAGPLVPAAVAGVVFVLFAWRVPATPPSAPEQSLSDQVDVSRLLALLGRPSVLFTTVIAMVGFFTWQSFSSFFPTFLEEYAGLSTPRASLVFGVTFAITIGAAPALGWASDATGRDAAIAVSLVSGVAGYALFLFLDGPLAVAAGTVLVAVGLSWPGVVNSRFMDHLGPEERGTGFGMVRTVVMLVSSLGSVVTGTLAERVSWLAAYGLVAALLGLLVALLVCNRVLGIDA